VAAWFLLLVAACLLSACATPRWVKPEASKSDFVQDQSTCMKELQEPPPSGVTDQQVYQTCMNAHGWKPILMGDFLLRLI